MSLNARRTHLHRGPASLLTRSAVDPSQNPRRRFILKRVFRTRIVRRFCANERELTGCATQGAVCEQSSMARDLRNR